MELHVGDVRTTQNEQLNPDSDPLAKRRRTATVGENSQEAVTSKSSLWSQFDDDDVGEGDRSANGTEEHNHSQFTVELETYEKAPKISQEADIFEWWNSSPFSSLKGSASKYLSAPAKTCSALLDRSMTKEEAG